MIAFVLAAALAAAPAPVAPSPHINRQEPTVASDAPVQLEDVEVTGASLDSLIRSFVNEVAAPNRRRGLARWDDRVCVGVANLRAEPAQYIVDRISTVAEDFGLTPGLPGCTANIMIVASDDPAGLAETLVRERHRAFRMGGTGMDHGGSALRAFVASEAPVRWWQVAVPVDSETGNVAVRIPGECRPPCAGPLDYAPIVNVFSASRLSTQIVDNLTRTIVILDIDQIGQVSIEQLADYVAMVSLAQIDPEADTSRYASVLNVFDRPDTAPGLTDWDRAYLTGLYGVERNRANVRANRAEVADSIHRAHQAARDTEQD
jgi:hypothetical protein